MDSIQSWTMNNVPREENMTHNFMEKSLNLSLLFYL